MLAILEANAKQAALESNHPNQTLAIYEEYGFASAEELDAARETASDEVYDLNQDRKRLDAAIGDKKTLQQHIINYRDTLPIVNAYYDLKPRKQSAYYEEHRSSFARNDAAKSYFDSHGMEKKLPSVKRLQGEIDELVSERNTVLTVYREKQKQVDELNTIYVRIRKVLDRTMPEKQSKQKTEQEW